MIVITYGSFTTMEMKGQVMHVALYEIQYLAQCVFCCILHILANV